MDRHTAATPAVAPLDPAERDRALGRARTAWQDAHPDAPETSLPTALRTAVAPHPARTLLTDILRGLRGLMGGEVSHEDLAAAHLAAREDAAAVAEGDSQHGPVEPRRFAQHNGLLVALWLDPEAAQQLGLPGGEPAEALHLTLCYCGDIARVDEVTLYRAVAGLDAVASYHAPLDATVGGYGRFAASPSSDGQDVFWAAIDAPELEGLRRAVAEALHYAGIPPLATHGYTPHVTLAYLDPGSPNPAETLPSVPLRFSALTVMLGEKRLDLPLAGFAPMLYSTAPRGGTWRLFTALPQGFADAPEWVNVLPLPGSYSHPLYGQIAISAERNARFVANFEARVYQQDLPVQIDIEHDGKMSGAVGYIETLRQNPDGSVDARIAWTERGVALLAADAFRYFSPEWMTTWREPASGTVYQDVLIGGAICTRPFFKEDALRPLVASLVASEGQLYAPESRGGGEPVMALRPVAGPREETTVPEMVQLTEEQAKRFAELEARDAEREKAFAEMQGKLAEHDAAKQASEAKIAALEADAQRKRFTDLAMGRGEAGDGAAWLGGPEENVASLVGLATAFGEESAQFKAEVALRQRQATALKEAGVFSAIGSAEANQDGGTADAWGQIQVKASELVAAGTAPDQALAEAIRRNPALHRQYLAEFRSQ